MQHEPQVLEGDDLIPHQPADKSNFDPVPATSARARKALWIALAVILAFVAVLVIWILAS